LANSLVTKNPLYNKDAVEPKKGIGATKAKFLTMTPIGDLSTSSESKKSNLFKAKSSGVSISPTESTFLPITDLPAKVS